MKVTMKIAGFNSNVTVSVPDRRWGHLTTKEEARSMAIVLVCTIRETDIDIKEIA